MTRALLLAASLALAACGDDKSDGGANSTELSRAETEQRRTIEQADADVRAAQAASTRARQIQSIQPVQN